MGHGVPDYGAGAGEHDHSHAEQFPRAETVELVARALHDDEASRRKRGRLQDALLGIAVTLIALGLPTGMVIGRMMIVVPSLDDHHFGTDWLRYLPTLWIHESTGLSAERTCFLVSALAFGAATMLLASWARRRGWSVQASWPALVAILLAPLIWLGGTTPGSAGVGFLAFVLVFVALDADESDAWKFALRASGVWIIAAFLHVWALLLWPAMAWRLMPLVWRRSGLALVPLLLAPVMWFALYRIGWNFDHPRPTFIPESAADSLLNALVPFSAIARYPGLEMEFRMPEATYLFGLGGMGFGLAGLALAAVQRRAEHTRRVGWLILFALGPLVVLFVGRGLEAEIPYVWFAPPAFVGLLELSARKRLLPWFAIAASLAAFGWVHWVDTDASWRRQVEVTLEPGDVVFTDRWDRGYLLRERYDIRALSPNLPFSEKSAASWGPSWVRKTLDACEQAMDENARDGHRVVLDGTFGDSWLTLDEFDEIKAHAKMTLPR